MIPSELHIDAPLSNVSVQYRNKADLYISEKAAPVLPVKKESGKIFVYSPDNLRVSDDLRAPGVPANRITSSMETPDTYFCQEHSHDEVVTQEDVKNADEPITPEIDATERVTDRILLNKENDFATQITTTSNYASASYYSALSGTNLWSDYNISDPQLEIFTRRETVETGCQNPANTLIVTQDVHRYLSLHPRLKEIVKYSSLGVLSIDLLKQIFEVENYFILKANYVSSMPGQTVTKTYLKTNKAVLCYVNPDLKPKSVTFIATLRQEGYRQTKKWWENKEEATYIRVSDKYQHKIISNTAGYLWTTVV